MPSIRCEAAGPVAVLHLEHGKANALDTELCSELVTRLDEVAAEEYRAVVLTGTGAIFSAGVDLRRLSAGGARYVEEFLPTLSDAFLAVFDFPGPVVAAVNGHAIAGGMVLAAACDRRIMNDGHGRVGVTELAVGVPFPLTATEILRCAYGSPALAELTFLARTYPAGDALARGLVDELARPDDVVPLAVALARELGDVPRPAFTHTKNQLHQPYTERIGEQRAVDDAHVARVWSSPEALASVAAFVDTTLR